MQRKARFAFLSAVGFIAVMFAAYIWVLPWATGAIADRLPLEIGRVLADQTLKALDRGLFQPSEIPQEQQHFLRAAFQSLGVPLKGKPEPKLLFRSSSSLQANAFTLPDGTIIVLDSLVASIADEQQILAVLAHELGHVHGNDGLQLLLETSAVGAFLTFYVGDFSTLLVAAPAAVVQARYSQTYESRADDYAAALLSRNGLSPALLAEALEKLEPGLSDPPSGGYLSSHPNTASRIRRLREMPGPPKPGGITFTPTQSSPAVCSSHHRSRG
jgi:Zn-dependent protease with chaperone function